MPRRQLSYVTPPQQSLNLGTTTSSPGVAGAKAWSTLLGEAVSWNGTSWQAAGAGTRVQVHGATFTDVDYYTGPYSAWAVGNTAGFMHGYLFRVDTATPANISGQFVNAAGGAYSVRISSGVFTWSCGNNADSDFYAPTFAFTAQDVGRYFAVLCTFNGTELRTYSKNVEVGSGTPLSGTLNVGSTSAQWYFGKGAYANSTLQGVTLLGMIGGNAVPTLAEYQTWYSRIVRRSRLFSIPGKTTYRYDFVDVAGTAPATINNREGAGQFTRMGQPGITALYSQSWSW